MEYLIKSNYFALKSLQINYLLSLVDVKNLGEGSVRKNYIIIVVVWYSCKSHNIGITKYVGY